MQGFFARDVEVSRCSSCGGIWFDWGELAKVIGRTLEPEPLNGYTERRCAYCRITMAPAVLPGGIPVETCTACRGIYLDAGELTELGGSEPPPPRPSGSASPALSRAERREKSAEMLRDVNTFACVKCGKRFPLREGNALRGGLACRACTPQPHHPPRANQRDLLDILVGDLSGRRGILRRRPWSWW